MCKETCPLLSYEYPDELRSKYINIQIYDQPVTTAMTPHGVH